MRMYGTRPAQPAVQPNPERDMSSASTWESAVQSTNVFCQGSEDGLPRVAVGSGGRGQRQIGVQDRPSMLGDRGCRDGLRVRFRARVRVGLEAGDGCSLGHAASKLAARFQGQHPYTIFVFSSVKAFRLL